MSPQSILISNQKMTVNKGKGFILDSETCDKRLFDENNPSSLYIYKDLAEGLTSGDVVFGEFKWFPGSGRKSLIRIAQRVEAVSNTPETPNAEEKNGLPEGYYISNEIRLVFNVAHRMSMNNPQKPVKILATGQTGYGKTTYPFLFGQATGKKVVKVDCSTISEPSEFIGVMAAENGSTVFRPSPFIKAITEGDVVIILDELTRAESWVLNSLLPLFDDTRAVTFQDQVFEVGKGVIVVATANIGYEFAGTFELDVALSNRFDLNYQVGPLPEHIEAKILFERTGVEEDVAAKIASMSKAFRSMGEILQTEFSTRTSVTVATLVENGMTIRQAITNAFVNRLDDEEQIKAALDYLHSQTPHEICSIKEDVFGGTSSKTSKENKKTEEGFEFKLVVGAVDDSGKAELGREMYKALNVLGLDVSYAEVVGLISEKVNSLLLGYDGDMETFEKFVKFAKENNMTVKVRK